MEESRSLARLTAYTDGVVAIALTLLIQAAALTELVRLSDEGVAAARQELADSFNGTLQFGTAGLRAALGAGPNRMNRVVVRRAAAGIAAFLGTAVAQSAPGTRPRAVVGYDARYNSDIFAEETAAIFTAAACPSGRAAA